MRLRICRRLPVILTLMFMIVAACFPASAEDQASSDILIVYFSRHGVSEGSFDTDTDAVSSARLTVGNTETLARIIQTQTGGDLYQIRTVMTYPKDFDEAHEVARGQLNRDERPELMDRIENLESYTTIFLCYPNWWSELPMPVRTFLDSCDLSGKTILPLCVSKGGGFGKTLETLYALLPEANLLEGLNVPEAELDTAENIIAQWISEQMGGN